MSVRVVQREGEEPVLEVDKRTLPKSIPNRFKHLRFSTKIPVECNTCPYRSRDVGGNGICPKFEADKLCVIRDDIRKLTEEYHTRDGGEILPLLEEELDAQVEKLKFFGVIETFAGQLNPEVSKRLNVINNITKTLNEIKSKTITVSQTEKKVLSPKERDEISQEVTKMITVTQGGLNTTS